MPERTETETDTPSTEELNLTEAEQTVAHIEQAVDETRQATASAPNANVEEALKDITLALHDIKAEIERVSSVKGAEQTVAAVETPESQEPNVAVETPATPQFRFIRRNGRKVKRPIVA
jgi:hypothetical protein